MILPEYLETVFVGEPPTGGWPTHFHIVTAWNPRKIISESQNLTANNCLEALLKLKNLTYFPILACSRDLGHREASFGITGIKTDRAIQLAKDYGQNAIIKVIDREAFVVDCETVAGTNRRQSIGLFEERVVNDRLNDPVNHPGHYNQHPSGVECVTIAQEFSYNLGCAIEYIWRAGLKATDPIEDLRKAHKYIEFEIKRLSEKIEQYEMK